MDPELCSVMQPPRTEAKKRPGKPGRGGEGTRRGLPFCNEKQEVVDEIRGAS